MQLRQGDLLLVTVDQIPPVLSPVAPEAGKMVLARGEQSGHAHVVEGEAELLTSDVEELDELFLRVEAEARLVHEEHAPITLPPGDYEVRHQREYTPREIRRVFD